MKKERHWVLPAIWAILLMLLLGGAVWAYHAFSVADWQSLDPSRLTSLAQTGAIHDKNGDYVTSLVGKENRTVIDTSRLPAHVVNAFLAAEDLRFYKHPGFDITRIIGAMLTNVRDGAFSQGASTISQQLIKLSHLSSQKTIARKLEEIHLALQLEKQYTKDEILDMYLNFIYFGQGAYGVQAAAEVTFGVDAAELTPAQAASLAAAIKAPSAYSLQSAPESNRERREYILSIMLEENMLTQAEYDAAMAEELTARSAPQVQTAYGWFVDAVLDERRADQRFDDVAQNRAFVRAALFRLAVAEQNVRADVQFFTGDFAQGFLGNRLRTHFGQLAFVHVGMHLVQRFRGDQFEHRVAEEFESFVVLGAFVLV